jgi:hypothetical protein
LVSNGKHFRFEVVIAAQSVFTSTRDALVYLEKKASKQGSKLPLPEAKCNTPLIAAVVLVFL